MITTAPSIPSMLVTQLSAFSTSSADLTLLPSSVAAASARAPEDETTVAASALPRLRDGPTVPDDVQTARPSFAFSFNPAFPLMAEFPAHRPTVLSTRPDKYRSPPFSTRTDCDFPARSLATSSEIAPATAAMGPIPILLAALTIFHGSEPGSVSSLHG